MSDYCQQIERAAALEQEAARIREEAFANRRLPDFWRVGQLVRFLDNGEWSWSKGNVWRVVEVANPERPAAQYQVFWTSPPCGDGVFWTTPRDVELVEDTR